MLSLGRRAHCHGFWSLRAFLVVFGPLSASASAQTTAPNQWTWAGGSQTGSDLAIPPVYGALGTSDTTNEPGGRWQASTWSDANDDLWLYGGWDYDSNSNAEWFSDVWKFSPSSNQWTWVGGSNTPTSNCTQAGVGGTLGVAAPGNTPGPRYGSATWTDSAGHLWLFSGYDCNMANPNDLWEYDPANNEWTWIGGNLAGNQPGVYGTLGVSALGNVPGGRKSAATWVDKSGHFWLFGGFGWDAKKSPGILNDLWEFDPSTGEWTWVSGSSILSSTLGYVAMGVYGTQDVPAPSNTPGSRAAASSWTDANGHLWLFGGNGADGAGVKGLLNDMWEFDPLTNEWVWRSGSSSMGSNCSQGTAGLTLCGQPGIYGVIGTSSTSNTPGGKAYASSWTETSGRLWLFGGEGYDSRGAESGWLGDLWSFDPSTDQWTWMGGYSSLVCPDGTLCRQTGVYGTLGVPEAANYPGDRNGAVTWTDSTGNFWMFGGSGFDSAGNKNYLDDLWVLQPSDAVNLPTPDFSVTANPSSLTVTGGQNGTFSIYVTPSGGFSAATSFTCSGLPSGATCSFSPATVTPSTGIAKTTVTVTTLAAAAMQDKSRTVFPFTVLAVGLFCLGLKKRWPAQVICLLTIWALGLSLISGCGGGTSSSMPVTTTSNMTVTATSGILQHSTTLSLTVN